MPLVHLRALAVATAAAGTLALPGCFGGATPAVGDEPQAYRVNVASGKLVQLSRGEDPVVDLTWSPYGDAVAYATGGRVVVRSNGGDRRTILEDSTATALAIDWSPGGGTIAFASVANEDMERIGFVSADGATTLVLDSFRNDRGPLRPDWSSDATRLAYTRPLGPFRLTTPSTSRPPAPQVDARLLRVYVALASGGTPHVVPTEAPSSSPQWSPDGESLLFLLDNRLVLRPTVGSEAIRTLVGPPLLAHDAAWAPNGRRIAFSAIEPAGERRSRLYVLETTGDEPPRRLVRDEVVGGPAWSPDGGRIAYADSGGRIRIIRLRSGSVRRIAEFSGAAVRSLSWSPTGESIAFVAAKRPPED
jgi:Tol biopolymer transport system component